MGSHRCGTSDEEAARGRGELVFIVRCATRELAPAAFKRDHG